MALIRGVARIAAIAGTVTAVSNRVSRRQAGRWAQQEQEQEGLQRMAAMQAQQPLIGAEAMQEKIDQLKILAELKARGMLTDQEFQAQKNAVLNW